MTTSGKATVLGLLGMGLLLVPFGVDAQVELGVDAGFIIDRSNGETITQFSVPIGNFRLGFPRQSLTFESLLGVRVISASDETLSLISFVPGVAFPLGSAAYVRGEAVVNYVSGGGSSASQFGFGGALGFKRGIGGGQYTCALRGRRPDARE